MGDGGTAVVLRRVPPNGALLCCDAGETDGTLDRSRGIYMESEGRELSYIAILLVVSHKCDLLSVTSCYLAL